MTFRCLPLFFMVLISLTAVSTFAEDTELGYLGESEHAAKSVMEAFGTLQHNEDAVFRQEINGTTVSVPSENTYWFFTDAVHPAHPAYVKREIVEKDGSVYMTMDVKCGSSKVICDEFVYGFLEQANQLRNELQKK